MTTSDSSISERIEKRAVMNNRRSFWDRLTAPAKTVRLAEPRRQARQLAALLLTFIVFATGGIVGPWLGGYDLQNPFYFQMAGLIAAAIVAYAFSRSRWFNLGSWIFILAVAAFPYVVFVSGGEFEPSNVFTSLVWTTLTVFLGSRLLSTRGVIFLAVANIAVMLALPYRIPELALASVLEVLAFVLTMSVMITAFTYYRNRLEADRQSRLLSANEELDAIRQSLEARIKVGARDLALAAEIGQSISRVRDIDQLLTDSVETIRAQFDLYYAQVYLTDVTGTNLVLRAGTGPIGKALIRRGHRLVTGPGSITGAVASDMKPIVVANTQNSQIFRPNPLLPDTRSEMAVPMLVGEQVVGVLDLQSSMPGAFSEDNLLPFETMASQLAVAIDNANLFTETSKARTELEARIQHQVRINWQAFLDAINRHEWYGFVHEQDQTMALAQPLSDDTAETTAAVPISITGQPIGSIQLEREAGRSWAAADFEMISSVANQVAQRVENLRFLAEAEQYRLEAEEAARRLVRQGWEEYMQSAGSSSLSYKYDQEQVKPIFPGDPVESDAIFSQPLKIGGETIGRLEIADGDGNKEDAAELVAAVAERLSAHIANLRLAEQTEQALAITERQAQRLALLNEMGTALNEASDENDVFKISANYAAQILGADHLSMALLDPDGNSVEMFELSSTEGRTALGQHVGISGTFIGAVIESNRLMRLSGSSEMTRYVDSRDLLLQRLYSTMSVPLVTGGLAIGSLNVSSRSPRAYDENSESLMSQIVSLLASTTENRRLFEQIQSRAVERAALNEISLGILTQLDPIAIYQTVAQALVDKFKMRMAGVWLLDEAFNELALQVVASHGPDMIRPSMKRMSLDGNSKLAWVAQNRRKLIMNDLANDPREENQEWVKESDLVSFAGFVLVAGDQLLGVLGLYSTGTISEQTVPLLQSLAVQIGTVVNTRLLIKQSQKRAVELETVARLSAATATKLETETLLQEVVDLSKSSFDLYHVHTYLLDDLETDLVLAAGSGEVGRLMVTAGRRISLRQKQSLVARAARSREVVVVNDIRQDPDFLPHPLLPRTRSEMALPLVAGDRLLGVLDVQASEANRFNDEDVYIQTALAAQVAVALQNAQLFEDTQRASFLLGERVKELNCLNDIGRAIEGTPAVPQFLSWVAERIPPAMHHPQDCLVAIVLENQVYGSPEAIDMPCQIVEGLRVSGELAGRIYIAYKQKRDFLNEESMLIGGIGQRVSNYVESRDLFEQTQQQLTDLAAIQNTTSGLTAAFTFNDAVKTLLPQVVNAVEADRVTLFLADGESKLRRVGVYHADGDVILTQETHQLDQYPQMKQVMESRNAVRLSVDTPDLDADLLSTLKDAGTFANVTIPLMDRNKVFALLDVSLLQAGKAFSDHDVSLLQTLADQAMIAIQRVRLIEETEQKARREQVLREITARVRSSADVDAVMRTAVAAIGQALGRRAFLYLGDE